jgi:hypothetical protein
LVGWLSSQTYLQCSIKKIIKDQISVSLGLTTYYVFTMFQC